MDSQRENKLRATACKQRLRDRRINPGLFTTVDITMAEEKKDETEIGASKVDFKITDDKHIINIYRFQALRGIP